MKKILIINDDFETMFLLKTVLQRKGYKVKFTGDIIDIPKIIQEFVPDLIIIDVIKRQVVEKLKDYKSGVFFKILLMTGYTLRSDKNFLPVDDIIEKPFNLPVLLRKIRALTSESNIPKNNL